MRAMPKPYRGYLAIADRLSFIVYTLFCFITLVYEVLGLVWIVMIPFYTVVLAGL